MFMRFLSLLILSGLFSCHKSNPVTDPIPVVPVNVMVNITLPTTIQLQNPGGWAYIDNAGNRGIYVYHTINDEYRAFDRTCSYQPSKSCAKLVVDSSGIFLKCGSYNGSTFEPCCHSQFSMEGVPLSGEANTILLEYRVERISLSQLRVYN